MDSIAKCNEDIEQYLVGGAEAEAFLGTVVEL